MAKFLRLHIRGIRSVGDEEHNVHKIEFLSPCTLISGPNGTGKTTTIEALNFVTTGLMPTARKQAFIHSTDVARKTRVDASVTLEFVDFKGRICTAVRRLAATTGTKNGAQIEEHTLAIKYPDGTTHTLNSKVCDFNKAILHHLGVPRAIFKYVIFCHQEESTWPLSEPKELKKRFDDIFQLTKFVRAQERMKKMVSDFTKELKTHEVQKQLYENQVKEKLFARKNYDECARNIAQGKAAMLRIKEQKFQGIKKSEELKSAILQLEEVITSFQLNTVERNNLKKQLALIRVEPYCETEQQLLQEIQDLCRSEKRSNFDERAKIDQKLEKNGKEKQDLLRRKADLERKISNLKAEAIHCESMKHDLHALDCYLRTELDIEESAALDVEIDSAIHSKIMEMSHKSQEMVKTLNKWQAGLRDAQENSTKIEVELNSLQAEQVKLEQEVVQIELKIKKGENANDGMKDLLKKEELLRRSVEELPVIDDNVLREGKQKREKILKELDSLKKEYSDSEKNAEKDKERESLNLTIHADEKKMFEFQRKYEKNWKELAGKVPDFPWTPVLNKLFTKLRDDRETKEVDRRNAQLTVLKHETMQEQHRTQEEALTAQELKLNEEIFNTCFCEPEEVSGKLSDLRKRLREARKNLSPLSAKSDLYESYADQSKTSGCCPLCDREFSTKREIDEFSKKLRNMKLNFPSEQNKLEKLISKLEKEETTLVKAEGQAAELQKIVQSLKEIRDKNKTISREMREEKKNLANYEEALERVYEKLKLAEELQTDTGIIQQLFELIQENKKQFDRLTSEINISGKSCFGELREKLEFKEKEYQTVVIEGEVLQKAIEERNRLQSKLNELGIHRVSLGETAAQAGAFIEQLANKKREIEKCINEIARKKDEDLPDAIFARDELAHQVATKDEERKKLEINMQLKRNDLDQKHQQYKTLMRNIQESAQYINELTEQELNINVLNQSLEENQQRQKRFEEDLRSFESFHQQERILKDQLTRMKIEKKIQEIERELGSVSIELKEKEVSERKQEYNKLQNELRIIGNEEVRVFAQMEHFEQSIQVAESKLATKECQKAEINYRDAIIELAIVQEAIADLNKYRQCLDVSLIQFHTEKMTAVNIIIDELWRKVYNSTDITTIRIRSEAASETTSKRATYDYNVMMVQESGAEVEMRGRCSAGQKMLASLLIRIALAEVFGGLCSMIALDEPTTNLDEYKVDGMANVLSDLIEARRGFDEEGNIRGRDMQMVVITHDERLVNKLTICCRPEYIYCLGKDEHGVSYLTKKMPDGTEKRVNAIKIR